MHKHIPNALTLARLGMTVAFVALLSQYNYRTDPDSLLLPISIALFVLAALTDALDGYLARKWNVVSVFGRIMDPTADKLLVLGAFVMLASPSFIGGDPSFTQVSGVSSWMVVVILARELLVTVLRAVVESAGAPFAAVWTGKWKMIIQSVAAPAILLIVWLADADSLVQGSARSANLAIAWVVLAITAISGFDYTFRGMRTIREGQS